MDPKKSCIEDFGVCLQKNEPWEKKRPFAKITKTRGLKMLLVNQINNREEREWIMKQQSTYYTVLCIVF